VTANGKINNGSKRKFGDLGSGEGVN